MRTAVCVLLVALISLAPSPRAQTTSPRLLVLLVVDQMRADYLSLFKRHWLSGFRTLTTQGAVFEKAAYPYANTVTCAGHATIGTGTFPRTHGITGNLWWDAAKWTDVDCSIDTTDAGVHVSYGQPAKGGNSPHLLNAQTLGDALEAQRPGSHVVVLSLKPDTAVGLAGRSGEVVTWFDGEAASFVTSRSYAIAPHAAMSGALGRNPLSEELSRTWNLSKPPSAYVNADASPGERPPAGRDNTFPHEIADKIGSPARSAALWQRSPFSDRYLVRIAEDLMTGVGLGRDEIPDLLAIGLSALDMVGHAHGPESREVEDILINLDRTIGQLLTALDNQVGRDRYVLALSADHGVPPVPFGSRGGRLLHEDVEDRIAPIAQRRLGGTARNLVRVRLPYVYFAPGVFQRLRDEGFVDEVVAAISAHPGVSRVLVGQEVSVTSTDPVVRAAALSYVAGRSGDLIVVPKAGWVMHGRNALLVTNHGSSYEYDTRIPLILFGAGVRSGRFDTQASPADIASTFASVARVRLEKAEGRILREALRR